MDGQSTLLSASCTMVGYLSEDLQRTTFDLLRKWTSAPCTLIDNTKDDLDLTVIWNNVMAECTTELHVLLNADVFVSPGWLDMILQEFEDPLVAVAGPGSNSGPQTLELGMAMSGKHPSEAWLEEVSRRARGFHHGKAHFRDIHGACYAVRKSAWVSLEGFDAVAFPFYGAEVDFNARARKAGRKVVGAYQAYVYHIGGYSVAKARSRRCWRHERG